MGFKFCWLVDLLEGLDAARWQKPLSSSRVLKPEHLVVEQWFKEHGHQVPRHGRSAVAFLSCIFPERLSHRSYAMQETRLVSVMGRILHLGTGRAERLRKWHESNLDFATCLQQIMSEAEMPPPKAGGEVTLEEIDEALLQIAANSPFSSPEIKRSANDASPHDILLPILRRLQSREAKWLIHTILKSYSPIQIPELKVMQAFHFLLPDILAVQNTIDAAVAILGQEDIKPLTPNPPQELRPLFRRACARYMVPKLGVMIRRQPYYKARSIHHCCQLARQRSMSVERKYDGEYCQIHIDKSKGSRDCIQIFSKSGKNSTEDRVRLHGAITAGLRLNEPDCAVKRNCIVEGELLVWSRSKKAIQPFHVIRKHVMHGLRFLGTEADSPRASDEQLMIVFYDILLLDDKVLINEPHGERRDLLETIVKPIEGVAEIGHRNVINFATRSARNELREYFVHAINERWEGLVLKGCREPYFSWEESSSVIKLKKDYIAGLGDTVDLCIVGSRRDQIVVDELKIGELSWTSFYLACIENREEVRRFDAKPTFRLLDVLSSHNISKDNILYLNMRGQYLQLPYAEVTPHLDVRIDQREIRPPTALFKEPFIVEVMGAGFEKPSNTSYFTLRFPRALNVKLHMDRSVFDTNTFEELQNMARESLIPPTDPQEQEEAGWLQRLISADGKGHNIDGNSQSTSPTKSTPGDRISVADFEKDGFGCRDVAATKSQQMPLNERLLKPAGSRRDTGKDAKRKVEVTILLSPSETSRKRRKWRCDSLPNGLRLKTALEDDSSRTIRAKTLVPISQALQKSVSTIAPFDPPAVFRAPRKTAARHGTSVRSCHARQPLTEISPISPQRTIQPKTPIDFSGKSAPRPQNACPDKQKKKATDASRRKICPIFDLPMKRFIQQILEESEGGSDELGTFSAHTCPAHRRVYLRLVDDAGSEEKVAHEIFGVCAGLREAWTARKDRAEHHCPAIYQSRTSAAPKNQQKVVMMFRTRISAHEFHMNFGPKMNPGDPHCDVCDILTDRKSRKVFLASHFFNFQVKTEVVRRTRSAHQEASINSDSLGDDSFDQQSGDEVLRNVETLSVSTTFDWDETISRLSDSDSARLANIHFGMGRTRIMISGVPS